MWSRIDGDRSVGFGRRIMVVGAMLAATLSAASPAQAWGEWSNCFDGGALDGKVWHKQPLVSGAQLWVGVSVGANAPDFPSELSHYAGAAVGYCVGLVENGQWTTGIKTFVVTNGQNAPVDPEQAFALWRTFGCTACDSASDYDVLLDWTGYETRADTACAGTGSLLRSVCTAENFNWFDGLRSPMPFIANNTGVEYVPGTLIQTTPPYKIKLGAVRRWINGNPQDQAICVTLQPLAVCNS